MFDWIICAMLFILNSTAGSDAAAVKSFANLQTVSQQKPATYQGTAVRNGLDESGFKQGSVSPHLIGLDSLGISAVSQTFHDKSLLFPGLSNHNVDMSSQNMLITVPQMLGPDSNSSTLELEKQLGSEVNRLRKKRTVTSRSKRDPVMPRPKRQKSTMDVPAPPRRQLRSNSKVSPFDLTKFQFAAVRRKRVQPIRAAGDVTRPLETDNLNSTINEYNHDIRADIAQYPKAGISLSPETIELVGSQSLELKGQKKQNPLVSEKVQITPAEDEEQHLSDIIPDQILSDKAKSSRVKNQPSEGGENTNFTKFKQTWPKPQSNQEEGIYLCSSNRTTTRPAAAERVESSPKRIHQPETNTKSLVAPFFEIAESGHLEDVSAYEGFGGKVLPESHSRWSWETKSISGEEVKEQSMSKGSNLAVSTWIKPPMELSKHTCSTNGWGQIQVLHSWGTGWFGSRLNGVARDEMGSAGREEYNTGIEGREFVQHVAWDIRYPRWPLTLPELAGALRPCEEPELEVAIFTPEQELGSKAALAGDAFVLQADPSLTCSDICTVSTAQAADKLQILVDGRDTASTAPLVHAEAVEAPPPAARPADEVEGTKVCQQDEGPLDRADEDEPGGLLRGADRTAQVDHGRRTMRSNKREAPWADVTESERACCDSDGDTQSACTVQRK